MSSQTEHHTPTVLVVDDDANILSAFEDFFRREHCTMVSSGSMEEAMKHIERWEPDLLITDIRLGNESGVTLLINFRVSHKHVPVIVITGYPEAIAENQLKQLGADYFLMKPLELDKLRNAVHACLGLSHHSH